MKFNSSKRVAALCVSLTLSSLGCRTTLAENAAAPIPAAWTNPSYGIWHSCVMGGGGYLLNIVQSPSDPKRLYVHGDMDGIFRSDDGGGSWRLIESGMPIQEGHDEFAGIIVNPTNPDQLAVACGGEAGPRQGVFVSDDGGTTWSKTLNARYMGNGPFRWAGSRIAGSCGKTGLAITATEGSGVWRSEDGGHTWTDSGCKGVFFTDVHIDRSNPNRVWLCAEPVTLKPSGEFGDLTGGFYRSNDGGRTFAKLSEDSPFKLVQDPKNPDVLFGLGDLGVSRSADGGTTWQPFGDGLPQSVAGAVPFYAIAAGPDFIVVVHDKPNDVYRLDAGQTTWRKIEATYSSDGWRLNYSKPPFAKPSCILVSANDPDHWFLTDQAGFYQSLDGGATWKPSNRGLETTVIHTITQDPANPSNAYLGACDVGWWWTEDEGTVFSQTDSTKAQWLGNVKCIDASRSQPQKIYAVGGQGYHADRIYVSTDSGKSVKLLKMKGTGLPEDRTFSCNSIVVDPRDSNSVYVATSTVVSEGTGGVYHSSDGGQSWVSFSRGLPMGKSVFQNQIWWGGRELAMGTDGTLLAISSRLNQVFCYDPGTKQWLPESFKHTGPVFSIQADLNVAGHFYIAVPGKDTDPHTIWGGLFRTDDAGATWTKILDGSVHTVAIDRAVKDRIAAATPYGVFVSTDAGATWKQLDLPPTKWICNALAFAGNRLLAGTMSSGAFWTELQ